MRYYERMQVIKQYLSNRFQTSKELGTSINQFPIIDNALGKK